MPASVSARLIPHPSSAGDAVSRIEVEAWRSGRTVGLRYLAFGDIDRVRLPPAEPSERTDGLWKRTCFEAFIRAEGGEAYHELNLSPSTRWAAYVFDGYRAGMVEVEINPPRIAVRRDRDRFELTASIDLARLSAPPVDGDWRLGLSAVIEDDRGGLSWWALNHPSLQPDFHHPGSHGLSLPVSEPA